MQSLDLSVLTHARDWLAAGHRVWLVTVAATFGASPRPPGSMLVMRDDGVMVGSVSGGCIEDDLVSRRNEFTGSKPALQRYGVSAEEARNFGLPCGGELAVLIESSVTATQFSALLQKIHAGEVFARHVNLADGVWTLQPAAPQDSTTISASALTVIHGPRWRLLIIGASEIAVFLAEIAKTLDFQVSVCDPRDELRQSWRVDGVHFVDGMPDDAVLAFKPDAHTVIVTVSHDPKLDDMALMEALKTRAYYVGAVGSQKTNDERRARLREFDLSAEQVAALRGPVGLRIGSRTPPEIAVAILAELIAARNAITFPKT